MMKLPWDDDALVRIQKIPFLGRGFAKKKIEAAAHEAGVSPRRGRRRLGCAPSRTLGVPPSWRLATVSAQLEPAPGHRLPCIL